MTIYDIFFFGFSLVYLPYLVIKGKAHRRFAERFGKLPDVFKDLKKSRPVWIHAVSVGEVLAIKDFVKKLSRKLPGQKIVLSTTTSTGNAIARKTLGKEALIFYFPVDFSCIVKRVIDIINPTALLVVETEIWPNLILELSKRKIPIMLLNGRISDRSFKGYMRIKFFFGKILAKINVFCMQTKRDAKK